MDAQRVDTTLHRPIFAVVMLISALIPASASAAIVHVWKGAPGPVHDGASWSTAHTSVQQAIAAAASGDEVWVAADTYTERVSLKSGVRLYGGFVTTETSFDQRDWTKNETIIDGGSAGSVVTVPKGAVDSTVLDGFTIRNGWAVSQAFTAGDGGGIYCNSATVTITHNRITGNSASDSGGGISCWSSVVTITDNVIEDNTATWGGGIQANNCSGLVRDNTFRLNRATYGAGIYYHGAPSPEVRVNTFTENNASGGGGGLFISATDPLVTDNRIVANLGPQGAGLACFNNASPIISENLFQSNESPMETGGGGAIQCFSSSPVIRDNTFLENKGRFGGAIGLADQCGGRIEYNHIAGNSAVFGGGIDIGTSSTTIGNNVIEDNSGMFGGGIRFVENASPAFSNNLVRANDGTYGGGILCATSSPPILNNTIVANSATFGGGIACYTGSEPIIVNTIVAFGSSGVYRDPGSSGTPTVRNSCVFGNTAYNYSTLTDPTGTDGNISLDPLFLDRLAVDYRLKAASPCIDAGNDAAVEPGGTDLAGSPRIQGAHVDIGAYEYGAAAGPFTFADVSKCLSIAAGLGACTPDDLTRLNVDAVNARLDMLDALRLTRKVAGLEPNP